ncbi:hypothetical protein BH24ACT7_BH24ACT7_25700 [soil metagenome]
MEYLTIDEVAARLRTTKSAIYTQYHRGQAPGALAVRVGRRFLWSAADLDAWFHRRAAAVEAAVEAAELQR